MPIAKKCREDVSFESLSCVVRLVPVNLSKANCDGSNRIHIRRGSVSDQSRFYMSFLFLFHVPGFRDGPGFRYPLGIREGYGFREGRRRQIHVPLNAPGSEILAPKLHADPGNELPLLEMFERVRK